MICRFTALGNAPAPKLQLSLTQRVSSRLGKLQFAFLNVDQGARLINSHERTHLQTSYNSLLQFGAQWNAGRGKTEMENI
jgi:hypothetical protein